MEYQKFIPEGWIETKEEYSIDDLRKAQCNGTVLQGFVNRCDENYNLQINLSKDIIGIIPKNEMDIINSDNYGITNHNICKNKVNQYVQFKVKEIYDDNNLILSRKEVGKDVLNWLKNDIEPGSVVKGIVKNIRKYGAFVDIGGGITGLLHIEDISISRIKSPEERFYIGQKIKVVIKSIDKENNRIVLSHKELFGNWDDNIQYFQEKMVVDRYNKRS